MESQSTHRDGRTGEERMRITRGLRDRQRTLERSRHSGGREDRRESLQGIKDAEDAHAFDQEWQAAAARGLPQGGAHFGRHGDRRGADQRQFAKPATSVWDIPTRIVGSEQSRGGHNMRINTKLK